MLLGEGRLSQVGDASFSLDIPQACPHAYSPASMGRGWGQTWPEVLLLTDGRPSGPSAHLHVQVRSNLHPIVMARLISFQASEQIQLSTFKS